MTVKSKAGALEEIQIIDALADPFHSVGIDIYGNYIHATNENPQ